MIAIRLLFPVVLVTGILALLVQWRAAVGFDALDGRWWAWLVQALVTGQIPDPLIHSLLWTGGATLLAMGLVGFMMSRPGSRTLAGDTDARFTHGSARWARWRDVRNAGLKARSGVVVGGWKRTFGIRPLRHDGPEHVLAFAPTRSGKGVGLVVPTLLSWPESALVLDIKGENYALSAGWRASQGQRVFRFDPASLDGSVRYNPLEEVRIGTDYEIADCQNIAAIIIDPEAKGLKDFWLQSGWEWLSAAILHVLYRVRREHGRTATLADVHAFMSVGADEDPAGGEDDDEGFNRLLDDMALFEHGRAVVNAEVRRSAGGMRKRASAERSGVHSSAKVQLALYSDPIVANNTSACDFRIADLVRGERPASLYIVIPPSEIQRLRPLVRILVNQFLTRLTAELPSGPRRHRLLLMLDEFTSIGKLEIFEKALAFMAGYGLKCFLIVQDLTQLQKEYGRDESIVSNCHIRIAYAPNKVETARVLSDMTGKTTLIQLRRTRSSGGGKTGGNVSEAVSEVGRPLMTPDECMSLPGLRRGWLGRIRPGHMLIFAAGSPPIYGRQWLYFQNREYRRRAALAPPQAAGNRSPAPPPQAEAEPALTAALARFRASADEAG